MHEWLYGKEGYYTKKREIGRSGDFYTSVSTSIFFGATIAKRLLKNIDSGFLSSQCTVVEIGAHKGYLLADIIQCIYTYRPELLEKLSFVIVEPFEENRQMQKSYFEDSFGDAISLKHIEKLEELFCEDAFFVANEIFDAFACEIIKDDEMLFVADEGLYFDKMDAVTLENATKQGVSKGELAVGYESFAYAMANSCKRCEFVTFDYGQIDLRGDFSLRVYANHKVEPFFALTSFVDEDSTVDEYFAKSDITYDVNFKHLIKAFEEAGMKLGAYDTQMRALVDFGLIELLEDFAKNVSAEHYEKELGNVKRLIDPAFMGERFKMVRFSKGEA